MTPVFRFRKVDWLIGACCLGALGLYLMRGFDGYMSRDLGLYSYGGQRVAEGMAPYVGIFERGGPLTQFLPGVGVIIAHTFGFNDILGMRLLFLLFAVASVGLIYVVARDVYESRRAGLIAASVMVSFEGFTYFAANGPRPKTAMVAFLLAALLALVHQKWFITGLFVSLATLIWQPVFIAAMAGAIPAVFLGVDRGDRVRAFARIALGGLLPALCAVGIYTAIGRLQTFMDGFVLVHARYTNNTSFFENAGLNVRRLWEGYGISLVLLIAGLSALLAVTVKRLIEPTRTRAPRVAALVGVGCLTVVSLIWTLWDFDNFPDAFLLLPSAAIGLGVLGAKATEHEMMRRLAVVVLATALTGALVYPIHHPAVGLEQQKAAVDALLRAIPGDDELILSVEAPQPLVLSNRRNPSRFQLFGSGADKYVDEVWPGGLEGYVSWIEQQAPTVIAVGIQGAPEWLSTTIDVHYRRAGSAPGWDWYIHKDLKEGQQRMIGEAIPAAR